MRSLFLVTTALMLSSNAFAITSLKQVQISNGERVDLMFDGKIGRSQIKTEYFNDTIQFSLADVSVYPAKISSVTGGDIAKIFAYQYAPKLVRCRITVRGKAEAFKDKIKIDDRGKLLTISFNDGSDAVASSSAEPVRKNAEEPVKAEAKADAPAKAEAPAAGKTIKMGASEKSLLDRIMKDPADSKVAAKIIDAPKAVAAAAVAVAEPSAVAAEPPTPNLARPERSERAERGENSPTLAGGKPLASPIRMMGKFALVLGLFGLVALALRKILRGEISFGSSTKSHGSFGAIRRFAANRLGKPAKMIEIISTHHLGPKKSIVVANIAGRTLVLGITNESINLITQIATPAGEAELGEEEEAPMTGADLGPTFAGLLASQDAKPTLNPPKVAPQPAPQPIARTAAAASAYNSGPVYNPSAQAPTQATFANPQNGVRSQIRSRLEGLKPL